MFLRRQSATPDESDATSPGADGPAATATTSRAVTASKGRPTPKRSEAERRRRQPFAAPSDKKTANRQYRARERDDRARKSEAMRRGEDWALPARDRGPVKALARDYVDSKRRLSEYYMYGLLVAMVLLFVKSTLVQSIVPIVVMAAIFVMLIEGILIGYRVNAMIQQRLPGESTRGVRLYAAMRALQIRQLRMPKPRIKPGDSY